MCGYILKNFNYILIKKKKKRAEVHVRKETRSGKSHDMSTVL